MIRTHDPHEVLKALSDRTDVLLEGGRRSRRLPARGPSTASWPMSRDPLGADHRGRRRRVRASPGLRWRFDGCSGSRTCC
ncbi:Diaminohydroxyphosphoribosylaminopyrimidine deaminase domain protein [Mycobacterium xenopi 4042]|uniref:Diaminohydroxyphosphoribosylaminopyrimidine deaminase domain protein n=1 Tax=Mycobacterium xenopi 4042 TaxID=1299334 RepID=X7ZIV9_MYCXE|nr:Diaminohydroxyphosphoribosylaminopyrimidine deaminase domain protein [Mycobacterium xenopi 4042]